MSDNKHRVIGVRFKKAGKIYYFDPQDLEVAKGNQVIVETARGTELGDVVVGIKEVTDKEIVAPLKKVIRLVTEEDLQIHKENKEKEKEAFQVATEKITKHQLEMKLVDVEFTFDKNKIIFYFTADGRIDFRELVKDLAAVFKTRIELRQIGVRDEAKLLGGIGPCGKSLCCATWLGDFDPVTIKMAKEQNLSLNPTKISGICGRLFCCLRYEHEHYNDMIRRMPAVGSKVKTELGVGEVTESVILCGKLKVKIKNPVDDVEEIKCFSIDEVTPVSKKKLKDQLDEKPLEKEVKELEDKE
ncbi:Cell fate regulator YaaT, PSP1 superfamily (controls sporulation, competence, biofilm development) [Tindallia magadiensis]|uniref:Cell fate regulator YaaT, PSP1 superfamily (Controls sporulation, competence, biofilm development) n=1 Tax=Tindallia magadiensis TaxID=69895 RepID=A0A1I3CWM9_9FIRM|nr:stage 0 sporulation family protein [Tindallia magadiensis]SFH78833.1 Cell fate regulator YaaT, PSP1 superfamily (controls sporulation, competence, biofilm development) [Tindallia magadiensis]